MLILLPPSETKAVRRRGRPLDLDTLSLPELTPDRRKVLEALSEASGRADAAGVLGLSPNLTEEIARNTRLATAPTLPAADLYTGVLYDALDLAGLDAAARRRASRRLLVVSALFGALRLTDRVPPYRLSMAVNLPGVGPLAAHWRDPLGEVLPATAGRGLVVDCRSSTYAAAWAPEGALAERWVQIRVPGATHLAKHTRGLVARALCGSPADPRRPEALAELLAGRFRVRLHEPARAGKPWVLDASTTTPTTPGTPRQNTPTRRLPTRQDTPTRRPPTPTVADGRTEDSPAGPCAGGVGFARVGFADRGDPS